MARKTQSVRVDNDLWKKAKLYAVRTDQSLSELVEKLLREKLGREQK